MPYCPNCQREKQGVFCDACGARLEPSPSLIDEKKGDVGLDRSARQAQSQTVIVNPSAATSTEAQPWGTCPLCGRHVRQDATFTCRRCGRPFICLDHQDREVLLCTDCARGPKRAPLAEATGAERPVPLSTPARQALYLPRPHLVTAARPDSYIAAPSAVLEASQGTVAVWVLVQDFGRGIRRLENNRYIFAHDTNDGHVRPFPGGAKYVNVFSLSRGPAVWAPPRRPCWKLWVSNADGDGWPQANSQPRSKPYPDTPALEAGWHHFLVRWDHTRPLLEALIDGNRIIAGEDYLRYWPTQVNTSLWGGTWQSRGTLHYVETHLCRLQILPFFPSGDWIADELAHRPAGLDAPLTIWQQIGIEMVRIPAGEFLYGDNRERVYLPEYHLARTPVTNAQYRAFVDAAGHRTPDHWQGDEIPAGKEEHPVTHVSWADAAAFCGWVGCRLPTEQEWEKGARGTDGRSWPWGDQFEAGGCNSIEAGVGDTTPVGRYSLGDSPYGLQDMAGNVWEWTAGWHDAAQLARVLRGGSWENHSYALRCTALVWAGPADCSDRFGFRCALSPAPAP